MERIVLLDDEKHCTEILEVLLQNYKNEINIVGTFNDPIEALDFLSKNEIDLLFLDIQMPQMNGFSLLDKMLPVNFDVIFTTAFDQYAIRAFEYSAINYLLKPISEKALDAALKNWKERKRKVNSDQWEILQKAIQNTNELSKIALPTGTGFEIMEINKLVRCQSDNNYTTFIFNDGNKVLVCRTLKDVEKILPQSSFVRIHQSHLINMKYVKSISKQDGGVIYMQDGSDIPVSRQKKDTLSQILDSMLRFQ